jgi:hypothetical protein
MEERMPRNSSDNEVRPAGIGAAGWAGRFFLGLVLLVVAYQTYGRVRDRLAMRYFHQQCEKYGGEFIYRTVDNVEGVFQMRPRDPRDYFDRLRKGDIPEDPYGHTNWEAQRPETMFVGAPFRPYRFFENQIPSGVASEMRVARYRRFSGLKYVRGSYEPLSPMVEEHISELKSGYGFTWREERTARDIGYGVRKGVLEVVDLRSNTVLAKRVGFFVMTPFAGDMEICPKGKDDDITFKFVRKVLRPLK